MQNVLTGESVSIVFDIVEDGQFVSPEVDTVSYTVRDNAGQAVSGHTDAAVSTTEGQTTIKISLPGTINVKTKTFEHRTVDLKTTVSGRSLSFRQIYRIHDWMPFVATPSDVRGFIGLTDAELRDQDIDLVSAYLAIKSEVSDLDDFLVAGDLSSLQANRAIVCEAVLNVAQSIPGRAIYMQRSETAQVQRFNAVKWDVVVSTASNELTELKKKLASTLEGTFPLFTLATPTDTITGG